MISATGRPASTSVQGFDYAVADRWDITAGLKYMIETHKYWSNPLIISVGASYRF